MSPESDCDDYALHSDPASDEYGYELAEAYDRYDSRDDPDPCDNWAYCPSCGSPMDEIGCSSCDRYVELMMEENEHVDCNLNDCPNCADYDDCPL